MTLLAVCCERIVAFRLIRAQPTLAKVRIGSGICGVAGSVNQNRRSEPACGFWPSHGYSIGGLGPDDPAIESRNLRYLKLGWPDCVIAEQRSAALDLRDGAVRLLGAPVKVRTGGRPRRLPVEEATAA